MARDEVQEICPEDPDAWHDLLSDLRTMQKALADLIDDVRAKSLCRAAPCSISN
jgi:hypothetical protein